MRLRGLLQLSCVVVACAFAILPRLALGDSAASSLNQTAILGPSGSPMMLRADQVDYNLNTAITVAHGHVEIDYNERIVQADTVTYDQNKDIVTADGHVVVLAPDGTVIFAKHTVLTNQ